MMFHDVPLSVEYLKSIGSEGKILSSVAFHLISKTVPFLSVSPPLGLKTTTTGGLSGGGVGAVQLVIVNVAILVSFVAEEFESVQITFTKHSVELILFGTSHA